MPADPSLQFRPFVPADAAAVARLYEASCRGQWPLTAADILAQSGQRWVAAEGEVRVASVRLAPFGAGAEDALRLSLCGESRCFSGLYLTALSAVDRRSAAGRPLCRVLGVVREDWSEQVHWFQATGFANVWQSFGAHLDLTGFDPERFAPQLKRLYLAGAEVREWQPAEGLEELYALHLQFEEDAPSTPAIPAGHLSREEFAAALRKQRTWVVWQGPEALAYTSFAFSGGQPDSTGTVTRRDRRGRGLATALKAQALTELRQAGWTQASTGGAVANLPMLRANLRLGYRPEPLWLTFERRL
ncbi:hypothetical protein [Deinococcus sp. Marseille-Q6407]|uniref:hypothetical protein n=1 Tax=Deinococcus sp. Marseille-Q6407 TaxID=2969223 RepID=UPI0021C00EAD|nr:hypothetical protein [Deinococcus sp. Marseille-Q6407]